MKNSLENKVEAIKKKARENTGSVTTTTTSRDGSSLHKVIKTKEQADRFMKLLQSS